MSPVDSTGRARTPKRSGAATRPPRPALPAGLGRFVLAALVAGLGASCARPVIPDPRAAVRQYAAAAERGDADAIYSMLTREAQRTYGLGGTRKLVKTSHKELAENARALASGRATVQADATLRYRDGEEADLVVEHGRFRIGSAQALPAGARTPEQALAELREALARRSYAGLMRVLTRDTRSSLDNDLSSLVEGLESPQTLDVKVSGDHAEVKLGGGHSVKLKREAGVWRIDDFD